MDLIFHQTNKYTNKYARKHQREKNGRILCYRVTKGTTYFTGDGMLKEATLKLGPAPGSNREETLNKPKSRAFYKITGLNQLKC